MVSYSLLQNKPGPQNMTTGTIHKTVRVDFVIMTPHIYKTSVIHMISIQKDYSKYSVAFNNPIFKASHDHFSQIAFL